MYSVGGEAPLGFRECGEGKLKFFDDEPEKRGEETVIVIFFLSVFTFLRFFFFLYTFFRLFPSLVSVSFRILCVVLFVSLW